MSIDWITVIAQIANFLVLVWLLKHFLYRPILDGIAARESEIAKRMAEAGKAQKQAQAAEAEYRQLQKQLLLERDTMVEEALSATETQRDNLLTEARARLDQEQKEWRKFLQNERQRFTSQLQHAASETLLELTRKALRDLADETLEEAIVRHVGKRLQPVAVELSKAAGDSSDAVATTRDTLPDAARTQLKADVAKLFPDITLRFETDSQQAPGLILSIGGAQVAWTIDSYTDGIDALVKDRMTTSDIGRTQSVGG